MSLMYSGVYIYTCINNMNTQSIVGRFLDASCFRTCP